MTQAEFAALMTPLGPFEPAPRLAAAVSGGADSMALALLADAWVRERGGSLRALVIDHGLRVESAAEAALTVQRLAARSIPAATMCLTDLRPGPALAERARAARYAALRTACVRHGILHLLLGHHAADQAETVLMRQQSNSGPAGLAAMPALSEQLQLRLLRPLLGVPPVRLRATLRAAGVGWVDDPSNRDQRTLRARVRAGLDDPDGTGPAIAALCDAARAAGAARAAREAASAAILARRAAIHPEGYALLSPGPIDPAALAALIQTIAGAPFPPATASVAALAAEPHPATLAGVRLMPAGRLGDGLLLVREAAAMGPPAAVRPGAIWDGRFRLAGGTAWNAAGDAGMATPHGMTTSHGMVTPDGMATPGGMSDMPPDAMSAIPSDALTIGALGADSARLRRWSRLPAAVLQTLPALRRGNSLVAVPHLLYPDAATCVAVRVVFSPRRPAAGAPFLTSPGSGAITLC